MSHNKRGNIVTYNYSFRKHMCCVSQYFEMSSWTLKYVHMASAVWHTERSVKMDIRKSLKNIYLKISADQCQFYGSLPMLGYTNEVTLPKIRLNPPRGEDNLTGGQTPKKSCTNDFENWPQQCHLTGVILKGHGFEIRSLSFNKTFWV